MGVHVAVTQHGLSYKIAPLEGKSAKILTALMARAAAADIEFHPLQVLIWNIHAGLTYDKMSGESRQLVDRLIPEYRGELNEDLFASGGVSKLLKKCPFCPKIPTEPKEVDEFTQRYRHIQDYLQRYANNFDKLQERFVNVLPGDAPASPTTWSRVNPRVYMRLTGGRIFGEMANLEIRVLPSNTAQARTLPSEPRLINASFGEASPVGTGDPAAVPFGAISYPNGGSQALGVVAATPCVDANAFLKALDANAQPSSISRCARYVDAALNDYVDAGGTLPSGPCPDCGDGHPIDAADFGPWLISHEGCVPVGSVPAGSSYWPVSQAGDIAVFGSTTAHSHGHIAAWDGTQWVSDFKQPNFNPYHNRKSSGAATIYRCRNACPSTPGAAQ